MCWTSEAWGTDAISPAAWLLAQTSRIKVGTAIIQMQSRSPALAAMTSMTLQEMSGGRFVLGIGPSGPQVIEGWHGVPFGKPLARTREYISIVRQILNAKACWSITASITTSPITGRAPPASANRSRPSCTPTRT